MIRFLSPGEISLPSHPLLGPTMATLLACSHPDAPAEWWIQEESGSLLCRRDGVFYLCPAPRADGEELARFVRMAGFRAVQTTSELEGAFAAPDLVVQRRRLLLGPSAPPQSPLPQAFSAGELEKVAAACFPDFAARRDNGYWLWDFSRRQRAGRAFAGGIREEGVPVCAGAITHQDDRWAVLGYISCLPSHRGRGLGSQIVGELCALAASQGRRVSLLCRPELLPFYHSLGFTEAGEILEIFPL